MSIAVTTNLLTMALCLAVLVQSVRMMRSLRRVKDGALTQVVAALEKATGEARTVLSDMKSTLGRECADNARLVAEARGLRDELSVMIGIADATAERIVEAVGTANAARSEAEIAEEAADEDESEGEATVASIAPVVAEAA